jgi:hypothetical protein
MIKVRPSHTLGPERPEILTIRKFPSHRITRIKRSRWAPRPTYFPTSNAKGTNTSPGIRIRTYEGESHVPCTTSIPHVRLVRATSGPRSRFGCNDDAPDCRCTSYEASGSVHEVASPQKLGCQERLDGGQEVPIVSALLICSSLPTLLKPSLLWFLSGFPFATLVTPTCCLFRLYDFMTRPVHEPISTHQVSLFFIASLNPHTATFATYLPVDLVCIILLVFMYILVFVSRRFKRPQSRCILHTLLPFSHFW